MVQELIHESGYPEPKIRAKESRQRSANDAQFYTNFSARMREYLEGLSNVGPRNAKNKSEIDVGG